MEKIVDMARTPAEKKAAEERYKVEPAEGEEYPYGLSLDLGTDELKKLGIDDLPGVGEELYFYVCCKVTRVHASADESNEQKGVVLQVTKMAIEEPPEEEEAEDKRADTRSPAERIYGKK